ncbi:MAG: phosphotransferase [Myxococcales bacterium]|nr:phosphotransferase [Myxococcales bacterium]
MNAVPHHPADVTSTWLSEVLGRPVEVLSRVDEVSNWGAHVRLEVKDVARDDVMRLRVKIGSASTFGTSEVDYYLTLFAGLPDAPLVRCHHAAADSTHYHLVLDDLAQTHRNLDDVVITEDLGRALVDAIGRLHAFCWPRVPPEPTEVEAGLKDARAGLPVMLSAMADSFSQAERDLVRQVFDTQPAVMQARVATAAGFSFVHGDLNPGNILAPTGGSPFNQVFLLDHQPFLGCSVTGLAVSDLAYAMVLWWPVEDRRRWANVLVNRWHAGLLARGVVGYSLAQARDDWRHCVKQTLFVPASRCSEPGAVTELRWLWEMHTRRALAAIAELG